MAILLLLFYSTFMLPNWQSEARLEKASQFKRFEKLQRKILLELFHSTKMDPSIRDLIANTSVDINGAPVSGEELFFILTNKTKDQFIALFIEKAPPEIPSFKLGYSGYSVRGAMYKWIRRWL